MNKNKKALNSNKIIILLMSLFSISILLLVANAFIQDNNKEKKPSSNASSDIEPTEAPYNKNETSMLAVICEVDSDLYIMNLTNAETGETDMYTYTGGTDIKDKFGKILSAKQLKKGEMADVVYDSISNRVTKIQISSDIWEYNGMNGLLFNTDKRVISFLGDRYIYDDGLLVLNKGKETVLEGFIKRDVFTIRGYGHKVCSITLTRGHGYLRLMDAESFIGGSIYVGHRIWEQIEEGMVLTVPEGVYDVTIESGKYKGMETVKISRDETVTFYAGGYGAVAESTGRVSFNINPEGAHLYIDNVLRDYGSPVELSYGLHTVEASLGGFRTYTGTITVDRTDSGHSITLSQASQEEIDIADAGNDGEVYEPHDDEWAGSVLDNNSEQTGDDSVPDNTSEHARITSVPDNTSEQGGNTSSGSTSSGSYIKIDREKTITLYYVDGTEVYFDGTYVGEVSGGKLVVPKYIGTYDIDLYSEDKGKVNYIMEVDDDGENVEITIPQF